MFERETGLEGLLLPAGHERRVLMRPFSGVSPSSRTLLSGETRRGRHGAGSVVTFLWGCASAAL